MSKNHQFDLTTLEDNVIEAHRVFRSDDNEDTRTHLFKQIRDLAFAVLNVGRYRKYNLDFEIVSYEYALYLFERIMFGTFVPEPKEGYTRFAWQEYLSLNLKHVIFNMLDEVNWQETIRDVEFLLSNTEESTIKQCIEETDTVIDKYYYAKNVLKLMRVYYNIGEIKRLFPIAMDFLFKDNRYIISPSAPVDIQDFLIILVCLSKRLAQSHELLESRFSVTPSKLEKIMKSSIRSTVFLSSVVSAKFFPKELLLALDTDSLYRLCSVVGGQTIRIPSLRELDTIIGATVAVSNVILKNEKSESALKKAKKNLNLVFATNISMQKFINNLLMSYKINGVDQDSDPIINMLSLSIQSMEKLLEEIMNKSHNQTSDALLRQYAIFSGAFSNCVASLAKVGNSIKEKDCEDISNPDVS